MSEEEKEAIKELKDLILQSREMYEEEFYKFANIHNIQNISTCLNLISKLQKELEEKTTILMAGADKVKQLEKENTELKRCIDVQKIMRKDMPKDTKLILMYSEDYKRIFKEE